MIMYYLLTQTFKEQEKVLVELILKIDTVECIYMLGSSLSQRRTETIFLTDAPSCRSVGHYYLLVLVNKDAKYSHNDLQDRIENTCRSFIPVTSIVLSVEQFTNWLLEGHRFAYTIQKIAVLLYNGSNISFPFSTSSDNSTSVLADEEKWTAQYNIVNEFIAGAELYLIRKQNNMAMFMLHQAAEQSLRLLLKIGTGLHINTHNIDKLIRYCSMAYYKIEEIFPRNNEKNERLFLLLQKAYIHARYKDDFKIKVDDILVIKERVKNIQHLLLTPKDKVLF
ncbi:HEPN domain-containing protein [Ferruginibacter sp.]|nr:HEPN domain-containing protein [Ferruginibacter sp.]